MTTTDPVVVVGAGVAGLICARTLQQAGVPVMVIERGNVPGGRIATATRDGYRCDRGFQVLPTGDTDVRRELDLSKLGLGYFPSGALVRRQSRWITVADPRRHPSSLPRQFSGMLGSWRERLGLMRWLVDVKRNRPIPAGQSIGDELSAYGLTGELSNAFLQPWLRGITLDPDLKADAGAVRAYVRAFARGPAALPAGGMAAIPAHLAATLLPGSVHYGCSVTGVDANGVTSRDGTRISARQVVVATDAPQQRRLNSADPLHPPLAGEQAVGVLHVAVPHELPRGAHWLLLNGDGHGPLTSVVFPSMIAKGYAPPGCHLAIIPILAPCRGEDPWPAVQRHLQAWFGRCVERWNKLDYQHIDHALPAQTSSDLTAAPIAHHNGILWCGDCRHRPGIGPAMASGRAAAEWILKTRSFG